MTTSRTRFMRFAALCGVAMTALTVIPVAGAPAAQSANSAFSCSSSRNVDHYTIVNARGSSGGGTAAAARAFVPNNRPDYPSMVTLENPPVVDVPAIQTKLANKSAAAGRQAMFVHLELNYPARMGATKPSNGSEMKASMETYNASVAKGLESLEQAAAAARAGCPSTKIVALGYSQGSEVLQRFMSRSRNDVYAPMVHRVILVGNPQRSDGAPRVQYNTGVGQVSGTGLTASATSAVTVRTAWSGKVFDYCYSGDQICALPKSIGSQLKTAVSTGTFNSKAASVYRSIDWTGHWSHPSSFRSAITARF